MANHNPPVNAFKKGNLFYNSSTVGRKKLFATPEDLWRAACTYFEHCTDDLVEVSVLKGEKLVSDYKMLPMSQAGLSLYLGISNLFRYNDDPAFSEIMERIRAVMQIHNYGCAATGALNSRIMSSIMQREEAIYNSFLNRSKLLQKFSPPH